MVFANCTRASNIRWPDALQAGEPLGDEAEDKTATSSCADTAKFRARAAPASNEIRGHGGKLLAQVPCEPVSIVWGLSMDCPPWRFAPWPRKQSTSCNRSVPAAGL